MADLTVTTDLASLNGTALEYRIAFRRGGTYDVFESRIDFAGSPTAAQRARHLADHINASFGGSGTIQAASSGGSSIVSVTLSGATYGAITVKGVV